MPALSDLGALKLVDPEKWKENVSAAMAKTKGRVYEAAVLLNISWRQLFRWLALPELKDVPRAPMGKRKKAKPIPSRVKKAS